MEKALRFIQSTSDKAALISSVAMILIVFLILLEVFLRALFNRSTMITDEYSAYLYVVLVCFGLGYTLATDGHIRVKVVFSRVSERARHVLDVLVTATALALTGFALYFSVFLVKEAHSLRMVSETPSQTPMWIPQLALPLGLIVFALQLIAHGATAFSRFLAPRSRQ